MHYGLWTSDVHDRDEAIVKENEVLADIAQVNPGDRVLDAGCGVAGSGIWLAQNRRAEVAALNIVPKQLKRGVKLAGIHVGRDSLQFTEADYHFLPYVEGSFDVFWALESIEHSDNVPLFIKEAFRVLEPGGRAVIAGTFKGMKEPTDQQKEQLDVGFRAAGAFTDFRSADEIEQIMKGCGFDDVQNQDVTALVMRSAKEMRIMCQLGLPGAKLGNKMGIISQIMVDNTAWGVYQEGLFKDKVTSYHILSAKKET